MKINFKIIQIDMTGAIAIPFCPQMIKKEAQNILKLLERTPVPDYYKMAQFDKWLLWQYWLTYDSPPWDFMATLESTIWLNWITNKATPPENIRRARQWLIEHNYLIPNANVEARAQETAKNWRGHIK